MDHRTQTPKMTSHKAVWAAIASLLASIVISFLGVMPTSEEMLSNDLRQLIENVAVLAILTLVPGATAYIKRNRLK